MLKRLLAVAVILLFSVQFFVPVQAAASGQAMQAQARAGEATIDGVCSKNEYGTPFAVSASNTVPWGTWSGINTTVLYRFAWSEKGLSLAVTYASNAAETGSAFQLACNPGNQLFGSEEGLFITVYPNQTVAIHNHNTLAGDASVGDKRLFVTDQVTVAAAFQEDKITIEVFLPIAIFRIHDENFTFSEQTSMPASAFVMLQQGEEMRVGGAVSKTIGYSWAMDDLGLGQLQFSEPDGKVQAKPIWPSEGTWNDPNSAPSSAETVLSIFMAGGIVIAVILCLGIIAFITFIVALILFLVKRKKKQQY